MIIDALSRLSPISYVLIEIRLIIIFFLSRSDLIMVTLENSKRHLSRSDYI